MFNNLPTRKVEIIGKGCTFIALAEYSYYTGRFRTTRCRKCNAEIFFAKTKNGKKIPVDVEEKEGLHTVHFANCPSAPEFRKK